MSGQSASREHQLRDWLQYFDDLGIRDFYRDRGSRAVQDAPVKATHSDLTSTATTAPGIEQREVRQDSNEASSSSVAAAASAKASLVPARAAFVPVKPAASLFSAEEKITGDTLDRIREDIGDCTRCKLCEQRTNIVFGVGNPNAELVFVGEGPGRDEDIQGEPFVGRAGQLLTQMIEAMGLKRSDVYICNVVKCRPPENRLPERDEIEICSPFLLRQLAVIKPKVIVALGSCAVQTLLQTKRGITGLRGQFFPFQDAKLMATYHPAYLLRNPPAKADVWKDLQLVMKELCLEPPAKKAATKK